MQRERMWVARLGCYETTCIYAAVGVGALTSQAIIVGFGSVQQDTSGGSYDFRFQQTWYYEIPGQQTKSKYLSCSFSPNL